ncbi:allophanate hydrolase [Domibacillus sp. PGB-M46]|uniref:allophanate hydrolase n=1 Tax=Domibacillus sp. PGB-M46 TaxID=2910255 RepID=UPI001F595681|nr:allophanate hydrolase [Domibacillus sp. PGB-M46]MCI2255854.1 allophanate hydrolase [Domibacillus sp. PGB-M46]
MQTINLPKMLSIRELKEGYQSGSLKPEMVIEQIIERAEADRDMNIWITPPSWSFIRPYVERLKTIDPSQAPLWGIPFAIKDNIDLAGVATTAGCAEFAYTPDEHAAVVGRLIDAGAIPVGKANLDQFATGLVGTRSPYGETHNALNPDLISGGSSAGSAVSVARGQAAFSLGTDTAGSGRVPAGLNRLIGYKPSLGAWPVKGVVPACASLDCVTVFANNLDDADLVDQAVRGFDARDPWSKRITRQASALPKKILVPGELPVFYGPFADQYKQAWQHTLEKLHALGLPVEPIDVTYLSEAAAVLYDGPWVAERWADLGSFINEHQSAVFPATEAVLRSGDKPEYDAASVFKAMHTLQAFKQKAHQQLQDAVLIMPTAGGTWTREEVRNNPIQTNSQMGLYTNHCNLLDLSAVNIPAEDAAQNVPFGITLFSGPRDEHLITGFAGLFLHGRRAPEKPSTTLVAVCGLHMKGFPLEKQMLEHEAVFVREAKTASEYKLVELDTVPKKPGLIRTTENGFSIELELWEMPISQLGSFVSLIPSPLGFGTIKLEDGTHAQGFLCEASAAAAGRDISSLGGWRHRQN